MGVVAHRPRDRGLIPLLLAEAYLRLRKMEGLGMGDVKMLALIAPSSAGSSSC